VRLALIAIVLAAKQIWRLRAAPLKRTEALLD
jgi:hypothetical protein